MSTNAIQLDHLLGNPSNTLPYVADQQSQSSLDKTGLYDFIRLNMTYQMTLAGYTANPSSVGVTATEQCLNMVQSVTLSATGNAAGASTDTYCNCDLFTLAAYQYFYNKGSIIAEINAAQQNPVNTNGTYFCRANVKIPFIDYWSTREGLTRLDSRLLSQLTLQIQWRDPTAFVAGGTGGTATLSNGIITTAVREWQNVPMVARPWLRITQRKAAIIAQGNQTQYPNVPVGNVMRRAFLQGIVPLVSGYNYGWTSVNAFQATGQAYGAVWSRKINNSVQVLNLPLSDIEGDIFMLLQIPQPYILSGVNSLDLPPIQSGFQIYEPARQKKINQSIPMWGVNRADDFVDVAAPGAYGSYITLTDIEMVGATAALLQGNF